MLSHLSTLVSSHGEMGGGGVVGRYVTYHFSLLPYVHCQAQMINLVPFYF